MSNGRIKFSDGDVIAVYTITGGETISLNSDEFNLIRGIPQNSISQSQLNFNIPVTTTSTSIDWRPCSLTSTTGSATTATFPDSMTLSNFNDITVLWNSGTGVPSSGSNGNANRFISSSGSLIALRSGQIPTNRSLLIDAIGRGADQYSVQINFAASTATALFISIINLNTPGSPSGFNITNVWVR